MFKKSWHEIQENCLGLGSEGEHLPNMPKAPGSLSRTMHNHEVNVGSCSWDGFFVTVLPVTPELKHICYVTHFLTRPCCMYRLIFIN